MTRLRPATPADLSFLLELERLYWEKGFVGKDEAEVHAGWMANPDCRYWITEQNGAPAGFAILRGFASLNRCIELKRIAVAKPGQGIGRDFLLAIQRAVFGEHGAHRLWLDVYTDNERARSLYRKLGFQEEGTLRECLYDGRGFRSLVLMAMLEDEYRRLGT